MIFVLESIARGKLKLSNPKKKPKFRRDKEAKKQLIIRTFLDLIEEKGYQNVSTNQIAEKADISIGTIYNYFNDKADILNHSFQMNIEEFGNPADFIDMIQHHDEIKAHHFIKYYLENHRQDFKLNEAIDQALVLNKDVFHNYQANIKESIIKFAEYFPKETAFSKKFSISNLSKAIMLSLNHIDSLVHQYLFRETVFDSDEELIHYLVDLFMNTLTYFKIGT